MLYSVLLVGVSLFLVWIGMVFLFYMVSVLILGVVFMVLFIDFFCKGVIVDDLDCVSDFFVLLVVLVVNKFVMVLFKFLLIYLFGLFVVLLVGGV